VVPERVTIEYGAEWVQRRSELNTGLKGSREGQNEYRAEWVQRGSKVP